MAIPFTPLTFSNNMPSGYALDENFADIKSALQSALSREHSNDNEMKVDLDMNARRILNLPTPVDSSEAARLADVQAALSGGAANLITFDPYDFITSDSVQGAVEQTADRATATKDTVEDSTFGLNERVLYVGSVAELEALSGPTSGQEASVLGCPFVYNGTAWEPTDYVTPQAYGAVADGVADDTAAIQAAFTAEESIYFPSGHYVITSPITKTVLNTESLSVKGEDPGVVKVECQGCDFLNIQVEGVGTIADEGSFIRIRGFHLLTNGLGASTAISVQNSQATINPVRSTDVAIEDVTFSGTVETNWWNIGIVLTDISKPYLHHLRGLGYNNQGDLIYLTGANKHVDSMVSGIIAQNMRYVLHADGEVEGIYVDKMVAVGVESGVRITPLVGGVAGRLPLFQIVNSHINCTVDGGNAIYLDGFAQTTVENSVLLFTRGAGSTGIRYISTKGSLNSNAILNPVIKNPTSALNTTGIYLSDDIRLATIGARVTEQNLGVRAPTVNNKIYFNTTCRFEDNTSDYSGVVRTLSPSSTLFVGTSANSGDDAIVSIGRLRNGTSDALLEFHREGTVRSSVIGSFVGDLWIQQEDTGPTRFKRGSTTSWEITPSHHLLPGADNSYDLGSATDRVREIFSANGTINTSDGREKQQVSDLSSAETLAAKDVKASLKKFKWNEAVEKKGSNARWHFGIIAQDIQAIFASHGLNAEEYGLFCSDTWIDEETGNKKNRLGVRYNELFAFILSAT